MVGHASHSFVFLGQDEEEGDVELAGAGSFGSASYQDQPEKKTPPSQKKRLVRRTASKDKEELPMVPSVQKPAPKGLSLHARKASGSPIPPTKHSQAISSLGAKPSVPAVPQKKAPAPPPVPKEDDFFAEMGFSAQPTFTAAKAKPATRLAPAPAPAAKASSLYAISGDDDLGGDDDDDWGDDADLDDLLND